MKLKYLRIETRSIYCLTPLPFCFTGITVGFGETSYQFPEDQSGQACVVIEGNGSIEGLLFVTLTITLTDETATGMK